MTKANKLKQRIRDRAERTGESYSTARRQILVATDASRTKRTQGAAETARTSEAKGAVSEAKCIEKTGHGFDHWFAVLDRFGAPSKGHTLAARHLLDDHKVSAWYAQSITVAYERARGMRELNQRGDGFGVSVTRTLPASLRLASDTLAHKAKRNAWALELDASLMDALDDALTRQRLKRETDASRIRYRVGDAAIEIRLAVKGAKRTSITVAVSKLKNAKAVEVQRTNWRAALDAMRKHLTSLA